MAVRFSLDGEEITETQQCTICEEVKPVTDFPRHAHRFNNLDSRCFSCVKRGSKERAKLHKAAPPKPADGLCECCGKPTTVWVLDHDHETLQFRGWVCDSCNLGIGKLGDTLAGVERAVVYLSARTGRSMVLVA